MMCIDLDSCRYGAVVADPKAAPRAIQYASRPNPCVATNVDLTKDEDVIIHGGSFAEAIGCGII
ncbi:hypothetical protein CRBSH125_03670 [Afipia carboxidovorans]|nr:hypothetical protein CRBSH125_03670 [Afipia carboxidovorans]